jgi:hypothetical protein
MKKRLDTASLSTTRAAGRADCSLASFLEAGIVPHLRGAEVADHEHRLHWGHGGLGRLGSAYASIVGPNPDCHPGDLTTAADQLGRVEMAISKGGWTRGEWKRLYRMRKKWSDRLHGQDVRYSVVGNRGGGLPSTVRSHIEFTRIVKFMRGTLDGTAAE